MPMKVDWLEFTNKLTNWADRESNDYSYRFSVVINNDYLILTSKFKQFNKICRLKYTKEKYYKDREVHADKEIIPILIQLLKEQYKEIKWSVIGTGRRKKYNG